MQYEWNQAAFDQLPPDQRRAALRLLRDMEQGHRGNPLWRFDPLDPNGTGIPHLKQHEWLLAHRTPEGRIVKVRVFLGGNRSGKSLSGVIADILECVDRDVVPPHLQQYKRWDEPVQIWVVSVTSNASENTTIPYFREWTPAAQLVGGQWARAFSKEQKRLHFKNGSVVQFMTQGMDQQAFKGAKLHRVHFDEEPLYDHGRGLFSESLARIIDTNGDVLLTMTPQDGFTWVGDDIYEPWQQQCDGEDSAFAVLAGTVPIYVSTVSGSENPTVDDESRQASLALASSDEEREAREHGRFVTFSGLVFPDWSPERHVVPDADARAAVARARMMVVGLDPGFRHMAAATWVVLDEDDHVWVVAELAEQETIVSEVAKKILGINAEHGFKPDAYIADPAILKRDSQTGVSDQQAFAVAGVAAAAGQNDVRPGINRIRHLMRNDRLHVAASCTELIWEMKRYRWVTPKRSEHATREVPVKKDDHCIDGFRYACMALPIDDPTSEPDTRSKVQRIFDAERARMASRPAAEYDRVG